MWRVFDSGGCLGCGEVEKVDEFLKNLKDDIFEECGGLRNEAVGEC